MADSTGTPEIPLTTPEEAGEDAREDAQSPQKGDASQGGPFGGLSPADAARKRWSKPSARDATTPDDSDAAIIASLRRKASKGDVNAARELREWHTLEHASMRNDAWIELLSPRERALVRRLIDRALSRSG